MIANACDARVPAPSTCVARFIAARTSGGRFVAVWVMRSTMLSKKDFSKNACIAGPV
jgi:hypothetical protein